MPTNPRYCLAVAGTATQNCLERRVGFSPPYYLAVGWASAHHLTLFKKLELITKLPVESLQVERPFDSCHSRESGNPDVFIEVIFSFVIDSYDYEHLILFGGPRNTYVSRISRSSAG